MYATATESNIKAQAAASQSQLRDHYIGDSTASSLAPATQFDQMRNRIGMAIESTHSEIHMLRDTLANVLPAQVTEAVGKEGDARPAEHSSPLMEFMRHVESSLASMRSQLEYMRVRTPF